MFNAAARRRGYLALEQGLLKRNTFRNMFPYFKEDPSIELAFFNEFTDNEIVTFEQFLKILSIIAYGSPEEQTALTLKILDLNEDGVIEKNELIRFINALNNSLRGRKDFTSHNAEVIAFSIFDEISASEMQNDEENSSEIKENDESFLQDVSNDDSASKENGNASLSAADIISKTNERIINAQKINDEENPSLTYKEFAKRAAHLPEFSDCFGVNSLIIQDIISKAIVFGSKISTYEGPLTSNVWNTRYAYVANGFIVFFEENDTLKKNPLDVFILQLGSVKNGNKNDPNTAFYVSTHKGIRRFIAKNVEDKNRWINAIRVNCGTNSNPNHSFSPLRRNTGAAFFTNGREFFEDLVPNLKAAKERILITAWHLTPDLYLSRDGEGNFSDKLIDILKERADAGVKVYVLIWDEVNAAFPLGSKDAAKKLNSHSNIQVIRDPTGIKNLLHLWSHHQKTCVIDNTVGYVGGIDIAIGRYDDATYQLVDDDEKKFPTLDYVNAMAKMAQYYGTVPSDYLEQRRKIPRMPWHDIHMKVVGEPLLDIERNFIERWESTRASSHIIIPYAKAATPSIAQNGIYPKCNVQVLRSSSQWALGYPKTEHSMYNAQLNAIENSKYFIYIENQFFISASTRQSCPSNLLLQAIVNRIIRAHKNKEPFKVVVLHPCQPSSDVGDDFTRNIVYWQLATSYRGNNGFALQLKKYDIDADDYIYMTSARNYGRAKSGNIYTEMIYIHSKLMIVDDNLAFISSNNFNDRSMLGTRDSEIGAYVEDTEKISVPFSKITSTSNSKNTSTTGVISVQCGKYAHDLRVKLFKTMINPTKEEEPLIQDPIKAAILWNQRAEENTKHYINIFKYIHNNIYTKNDLKYITNYNREYPNSDEDFEYLKNNVKGYIVSFPRDFLRDSWNHPTFIPQFDKQFC